MGWGNAFKQIKTEVIDYNAKSKKIAILNRWNVLIKGSLAQMLHNKNRAFNTHTKWRRLVNLTLARHKDPAEPKKKRVQVIVSSRSSDTLARWSTLIDNMLSNTIELGFQAKYA